MTTSSWSIEAFCEAQEPSDWSLLHKSSQTFLQTLQLSSLHPFCDVYSNNPNNAPRRPYNIPGIPPQGPLLHHDHLETLQDVLLTAFFKVFPPLLAMGELWLRLLSFGMMAFGMAYLLWLEVTLLSTNNITATTTAASHNKQSPQNKSFLSILCLLVLASCIVIATDTLYVLEFGGPQYGLSLLVGASLLVIKTAWRHKLWTVLAGKLCLVVLLMYLIYDYETGQLHFGHADEACHISEGLYYSSSTSSSSSLANGIVENWPERYRTYDSTVATPWMPTGDSRTGLPFLLNHVASPSWTRVWLPVIDDTDDHHHQQQQQQQQQEVVALDIAFPAGGHNTTSSQPIYLICHGLNGGSQEAYVKDFTWRALEQNSTVVVLVARGLMDLPVRGWQTFHGARWTDVHAAARALRRAVMPHQRLAGVGYSMGGIILANYVTRSGPKCALDAAVVISGGLDVRYSTEFYRAQRLWQPILTQELRDKFVLGKWGERVRARLTKEEFKSMLRAYHITEIDMTAVVAYHGFRDLEHYYSEMSALGDIPMEHHVNATTTKGSIHNLSTSLLVLHALDDPLVSWRTVAANDGLLHPGNLTKMGNGNLFLLLTKRGGHVGWPLGYFPFVDKWKWMNDVATSFVEAVVKARQSM